MNSSFDDQVYNLKEALWHQRRPRLRYPKDMLELERQQKIALAQATLSPAPQISNADVWTIAITGLGLTGLVLAFALW